MSVSTRPYIDPVEGLIARAKQTAAPLNLPSDAEEWRAWHERTLRQVREMIGAYPDPVPLNVEVVERHDEGSYIREKILYDSEEFATVPCLAVHAEGHQGGRETACHSLCARPRTRQG